jgi:hypothetical protein
MSEAKSEVKSSKKVISIKVSKTCGTCKASFEADEKETWKKLCSDCFNKSKKNKECTDCKKEFEIDPDATWKKVCSDCFKKGKIVNTCEECKAEFERDAKDTWKKTCFDCYKKAKDAKEEGAERKLCEKCLEPFMADQEWKSVCGKCYRKCLRKCLGCDKDFYAKESWKTTCKTCYKTKKSADDAVSQKKVSKSKKPSDEGEDGGEGW